MELTQGLSFFQGYCPIMERAEGDCGDCLSVNAQNLIPHFQAERSGFFGGILSNGLVNLFIIYTIQLLA